jgi:four helix bundle suffix protein
MQHQKPKIIPAHGGFRKLFSYQKAEIVYDATVYFTKRFFAPRDRTVDQMVQAARSGKQNIAEGSVASATSKETELKLTNVARASLIELLIDYQDFLRTHKLAEWSLSHTYAQRLQELNRTPNPTYEIYKKGIEHKNPEICANVIIGLIKVTCRLLERQMTFLEKDFMENGGIKERMYQARLSQRNRL